MAFEDLNLSELVYLAQEINPNVHRGLGRKTLLSVLDGEDLPLPERRIDRYRLQIMEFVNAHWEQVKPLLSCPAKSGDARACFGCTDITAAECVLTNQDKIPFTDN